jgi:hypothetical protein
MIKEKQDLDNTPIVIIKNIEDRILTIRRFLFRLSPNLTQFHIPLFVHKHWLQF